MPNPSSSETACCESPVQLHPPDDAVTAELVHGPTRWTVYYRPDGSADEVEAKPLLSDLNDDLEISQAIACIEERLLAAGRATLNCQVDDLRKDHVVAIWTLALPLPGKP